MKNILTPRSSLAIVILTYILIVMTSMSAMAETPKTKTATALLGGGCFWCIESDFAKKDGVIDVMAGYAGGDRPNPTYDNYYTLEGDYKIPHLEVIKVTYDPSKLTFRDVVQYHFENIDPTDGDGQFGDRGAQYRPAVFYANDTEKKIVQDISAETEIKIKKEVKVDILPMATFHAAEEYHQDYAEKNSTKYNFFRWRSGRDNTVDKVWNE